MARAMWKGAIQFGLVTIPIKLYLATESKGISFNMLHKEDLSRIQMKVWCPVEDEPISRSDTVKGYEYAPGEYVVITDEDLENVPLKTVRSIEIEQFTKAERDDAAVRFVKSAYYVEPDKVGRKAFHLLKSVLEDDGLTAICKVVIKDREALAALDPIGDTMLLTTLHWPDEIRSVADLDLGDEEYDFKPAELAMARQLVSAMTGEFDPSQYKDEYRQALETIIEAKVEGKETVAVEEPEESGKLIDLMAALEASVNAAKAARDSNAGKPVSVSEAKEAKAAKAAKAPRRAGRRRPRRPRARPRTRKPRRPPSRHGSARPPEARAALALADTGPRGHDFRQISIPGLLDTAKGPGWPKRLGRPRLFAKFPPVDCSARPTPDSSPPTHDTGIWHEPTLRSRRSRPPMSPAMANLARKLGDPRPPRLDPRPRSVDPRREHAPVDRQVLAADPAGRRRRQEQARVGDVVGLDPGARGAPATATARRLRATLSRSRSCG